MQRNRVLYTLILSLSLLFVLAPIGAGPNAVEIVRPADPGDGPTASKVIINGITIPKNKITSNIPMECRFNPAGIGTIQYRGFGELRVLR